MSTSALQPEDRRIECDTRHGERHLSRELEEGENRPESEGKKQPKQLHGSSQKPRLRGPNESVKKNGPKQQLKTSGADLEPHMLGVEPNPMGSSSDTSEKDTNDSNCGESTGEDESANGRVGTHAAGSTTAPSGSDTKEAYSGTNHSETHSSSMPSSLQGQPNSGQSNDSQQSDRSEGAVQSNGSGGKRTRADGKTTPSRSGGESDPVLTEVSTKNAASLWEKSEDDTTSDQSHDDHVLLMKNINHKTTVPEFCEFLAQHGFALAADRVTLVHIPCSAKRHNARGFAVVRCATEAVSDELYRYFHGRKFGRHRILVGCGVARCVLGVSSRCVRSGGG